MQCDEQSDDEDNQITHLEKLWAEQQSLNEELRQQIAAQNLAASQQQRMQNGYYFILQYYENRTYGLQCHNSALTELNKGLKEEVQKLNYVQSAW